MSAGEGFRLRCQSLLASGLASTEIGGLVGLAAASEVWGGDVPRERPAWYLWLRDRDGAYQLELTRAEPLGPAAPGASVGRFTVRHYPSPGGAVFGRFSAEERRIALEALDETGTPRIDLASSIPDALFTVGSIDWALDRDAGAAVLALASLDRLRSRDADGAVDRDVPGWKLAAPVFSLLVGLVAQVERRVASRLVVSRQPGFELVACGGARESRDSTDVVHGEAVVVLPPPGQPAAGAPKLLEGLRDEDAEIVLDAPLSPSGHVCSQSEEDRRLPLPVSRAWFGGAARVADRAVCSC